MTTPATRLVTEDVARMDAAPPSPGRDLPWMALDRYAWLLDEAHDLFVALADDDLDAATTHLAHLAVSATVWLDAALAVGGTRQD